MNGTVYLIGAGPGDPELLTVRAVKLLQQADAVVCDRLVGAGILPLINPRAQFHDVGKVPGGCLHRQDDIHRLLLDLARSHARVVRLKGGDPFIFGRGGEELLFLARHGIPVEVVPGITAANGCAAAVGIPLTHRGVATSVRFITGHLRDDAGLELDWSSLADPSCTLVFYMAVANVAAIVDALVRHGRDGNTPAALIHGGTTASQRWEAAPLRRIPKIVASFEPPTLLVVGDVVRLARRAGPDAKPAPAGEPRHASDAIEPCAPVAA